MSHYNFILHKELVYSVSQGNIIIPIIQIKELALRKFHLIAQVHMADK